MTVPGRAPSPRSVSPPERLRPTSQLAQRIKRLAEIDWSAAEDRRAVWLLGALMLFVGVLLMYMARGTTFYYDEWTYIVSKFGGGINSFLEPHNEHFSLIPIAIYKLMFRIVGMRDYPLYRLIVVVMHLVCVALVYDIARRRIGAWPALVAAISVLWLFAAWQNLLWAFQMSFVGSVMGGLAAWALIDRDTRRCDIAAGVALGVALSCSGLGIPFVPGIAAELVWQRRWRRRWRVAVPFALYLLWYTHYGVNMVTTNSVIQSPQWILEMVAAGFGALVGRDTDWGVPVTVLLLWLAAKRVVAVERLSPRFIGAAITTVAYVVLTGVSRSTIQAPDESRYLYLGAVCLVMAAIELLPKMRPTGRAMGVATVFLLAAALMGWQTMHNNALVLRGESTLLAAQVGAMQLEAAHAPPAYAPDPTIAPPLTAAGYFKAMREMGNGAGDSPAAILASSVTDRIAADTVLLQLLAPAVAPRPLPAAAAPVPTLAGVNGARVVRSGSCLVLDPSAPTALVALAMPRGGVFIRNHGATSATLELRRFSAAYTPIAGVVPAHHADALAIPVDASSVPWYLQVSITGPTRVCGLTT